MSGEASSQAFNYFRSQGWSPVQAAGIVGNLVQESALNPKAMGDYRNGNPTAFGAAQWRNERVTAFNTGFGGTGHLKDASFLKQLEYVNWELRNTYKGAGDRLSRAASVEGATKIFMEDFERPAKAHANLNARVSAANSAYRDGGVLGAAQGMLDKALAVFGVVANPTMAANTVGAAVMDSATGEVVEEGANWLISWLPRLVAIIAGVLLIGLAVAALTLKNSPIGAK